MYLSIFLTLCVMTLSYRLAKTDGRMGVLWGLIGLVITIGCSQVIANAILGALAGMILTVILMTLANIWRPVHKNAGLRKEDN
jgi:uncharacterized membrane protein